MVKYFVVQHPDQIKNYLKEFNPATTTWIVSDLKSRQEIQLEILKKQNYFHEDSVLRISDFWTIWMRRLYPQFQIVGSDSIEILIKEFIQIFDAKKEAYGLGSETLELYDASALKKYVDDLAPLILFHENFKALSAWLTDNNEQVQWQKWFIIAKYFVEFAKDKKIIDKKWVSSFLLQEKIEKIKWSKTLVFDLGSQMTSVELGLIESLSVHNTVQVFVPKPMWSHKFPYIINTYQRQLSQKNIAQLAEVPTFQSLQADQFIKFNSELSEVKFAVYQVRKWVDQLAQEQVALKQSSHKEETSNNAESIINVEIDLSQIAILSPQIEVFWPVLQFYLDKEGIPSQKDTVSPMISSGIVQRWLSFFATQTSHKNWNHLQASFPSLSEKLAALPQNQFQNYERFKSYFNELIDVEAISFENYIQINSMTSIDLKEKMTSEAFLKIMLKNWLQVDPDYDQKKLFKTIVKDIFQQSLELSLSLESWLELLYNRLSRKEIRIAEGSDTGIQILPINSAHVISAPYKLWIGLTEESLKGNSNSLIPLEQLESLRRDLDLPVNYPEESHADFNLRWFSQGHVKQQLFTCSLHSMRGETLNSSMFFLENTKAEVSYLESPTVVDAVMKNFNAENFPEISYKLKLEKNPELLSIQNLNIERLSPSDIDTYANCSYKFLAKKGFGYEFYDQLGFEASPMQKGSFNHAIFKFVLEEKRYQNLTVVELENFIENERVQNKLYLNSNVFWAPIKAKYVQVGLEFQKYCKATLAPISNLSHWLEKKIEFYYGLNSKSFFKDQPSEPFYKISGRIDRLDIYDSNNGVLIDYKSSLKSEHILKNWFSKSNFQLFLYVLGVQVVYNINIAGALFNEFPRSKNHRGYVNEENINLISAVYKYKDKDCEWKASTLFEEGLPLLQNFFENIQQNKFQVKPLTDSACNYCEWTSVCRINNQ